MRFGVVILPEYRWSEARVIWRRAEELGFDHAWTYDHLTWRTLRDSSWFATVPTLTAAALATERIRIGPLVASPNYRHPVPFAKELMSLDDISGGRLTLGIGAGGEGWDATALGSEPWSRRERADRFGEFLALVDRLLREPAVTARGRFYSADEARSIPGCVQEPRVPFAVAGAGPRSMELAARFGDTWVTVGDGTGGARSIRDQLERLDEACGVVGRDPGTLARLVLTGVGLDSGLDSRAHFDDVAGGFAAAGVTDLVVHWPRASEPFAGDVERFERIFS